MLLRCRDQRGNWIECEAEQVTPGYAVHRSLYDQDNENGWDYHPVYYTITHIESGCAAFRAIHDYETAIALAQELEKLPSPLQYLELQPNLTFKRKRGYKAYLRKVKALYSQYQGGY